MALKFAWRKAQFLVRYLLFYWKNLDVWVGDRMMFWGWILGLFWVCFAVCWYNFLWLGLTIRYRRKHFFLRWLIIKFWLVVIIFCACELKADSLLPRDLNKCLIFWTETVVWCIYWHNFWTVWVRLTMWWSVYFQLCCEGWVYFFLV